MRSRFGLCLLFICASTAQAGSLANGQWTGCGTAPAAPAIDSASVDAYNRSLKEVRDWQKQAQAYSDCIVKEANADNETIAKAATVQQERFRDQVAEIEAETAKVKAQLDRN